MLKSGNLLTILFLTSILLTNGEIRCREELFLNKCCDVDIASNLIVSTLKIQQENDAQTNKLEKYNNEHAADPHNFQAKIDKYLKDHNTTEWPSENYQIVNINGNSYEILKQLARNNIGLCGVFVAKNLKTKSLVAIKEELLYKYDNPLAQAQVTKEINYLERLKNNPYVINMLDYTTDNNGIIWIVLEYGIADLRNILNNVSSEHGLNSTDIRYTLNEILHVVQSVHEQGIIHLDLKFDNFLYDHTGKLKLIDFGSARLIQDGAVRFKEELIGTYNFMAPEVATAYLNPLAGPFEPGFKVGTYTDVWSLGCMLYNMMYKIAPIPDIFGEPDWQLWNIVNKERSIYFPDYPDKELLRIVKLCLQRDAEKRPSIEELINFTK